MKTLLTAITLSIATLGFIGCSATNDKKDVVNPSDPTPTPNPNPNPTTPDVPYLRDVLPEAKLDADSYGSFIKSTFSNDVEQAVTSSEIFSIRNKTYIPTTGGYYEHVFGESSASGSYNSNTEPFSETNFSFATNDGSYKSPVRADLAGKPYRHLDGETIIYDNYKPGKSLILTIPDRWIAQASGNAEWDARAFDMMYSPVEVDAAKSSGRFIGAAGLRKYYHNVNDVTDASVQQLGENRATDEYWFTVGSAITRSNSDKPVKTGLDKIDHITMRKEMILFSGTKGNKTYFGAFNRNNSPIPDHAIKLVSETPLKGGNKFSVLDNGLILGASFVYDYSAHEIGFFKNAPAITAGTATEYGITKLEYGVHILVEALRGGKPNIAQHNIWHFVPTEYIKVENDLSATTEKQALTVGSYSKDIFFISPNRKLSVEVVGSNGELITGSKGASVKRDGPVSSFYSVEIGSGDKVSKTPVRLYTESAGSIHLATEFPAWIWEPQK